VPPCSPDLNPIEQVFAKLKTLLRKARRANCRSTLAAYRSPAQLLHTTGVRQLHPKRLDMLSPKWKMLLTCQWQMS
jgi:hypothetical protein